MITQGLGIVTRSILRHSRKNLRCNSQDRPTTVQAVVRAAQPLNSRRIIHSSSGEKNVRKTKVISSNSAIEFPCIDALENKSSQLQALSMQSGPEPSYTSGATLKHYCKTPLHLDWGGVLPEFNIAYETWGKCNSDRTNVILLHTGLSASSHAHSTTLNPKPGWWEKFIGPGRCLDTDKYYIICCNVIGGCHGSTGPISIDPADGQRYATRFPIVTIQDMVRAQFQVLDDLGVHKLYASVGSSMGGMQSLAVGALFAQRVGKIASISSCARSHPYSIAMRHTQRQVLMMDPNWNRGFYYDRSVPPHVGMKLAREIATITYRSGPEWGKRFGRKRADPSKPPALCPDFLIETYLDHSGDKFCLNFDANSLLYLSKAMDLFDLSEPAPAWRLDATTNREIGAQCNFTLPESPYEEQLVPQTSAQDLVLGLSALKEHPTLIIGVASDILFPSWQQKEIVDTLRLVGNTQVVHHELGEDLSLFGHDSFLIDLENIGRSLKIFLG
ncbi:BgTH12-02274 [Blumeria graminis f. sp. triticale]|nr:BgTH12-02274 [Blumeria graminis f. sp. triticale]